MSIQAEHKEWLDLVFPGQRPRLPATVMLEEAGELLQAISKREQSAQFGEDGRFVGTDWAAEILDAIGDCGIAFCSLCNTVSWDFAEAMCTTDAAELSLDDPLFVAVDLLTTAASIVVEPYSYPLALRYVELLKAAALCVDVDLEKAVEVTWKKVKSRRRGK